jgi:ATP phosphoribosyltransferase
MLKIAIQKSGRLYEDSIKLLKECGIELNNGNKQLKTVAYNFPVEVYFFRDDDIPQYVYDGVADVGFVGENVFLEKGKDIDLVYRLGFGRCRLSIAVPKSMTYNTIKEVEVVLKSEAVLTANKNLSEENKNILEKLLLRINAVKTAKNNKYILLNVPNHQLKNIIAVLPGMKSPTVVPLAEEGWSSVQSVVNENVFWDVIEKLKRLGAEGILVVPIEKMII